ncbi:hypothetical protein ACH429_23760 [Streptomyces pathocidini]|uniref:Uncharacterized protein n=2 Tax=Streptomyces pathocidini TaxID=1650571 RepID=A0ABW7UZ13_9ACTN
MSSGSTPAMPPVRLPSEAELAKEALAAPLFAAAVRLARWAGSGTAGPGGSAGIRVGAGGELLDAGVRDAAAHLGFDGDDEDDAAYASEAWRLAVDTGLVAIAEDEDAEESEDVAVGTAVPAEDAALVTAGSPGDVLDIWLSGFETLLGDAVAPDISDLVERFAESLGDSAEGGDLDLDLDSLDWNPEEELAFLDGVLGNLYLLTALGEGGADRAVPLPALAASVIVPDDMDEPTDDILEEVSEAMMRLDDQFRLLAPIGLVEYQPVDEELIEELDEEGNREGSAEGGPEAETELDAEDVSRYGMVRLTPLGMYGVRARMLDAGLEAPVVGDLADKGADVLLERLPDFPRAVAQAEAEQWLARREPVAAARELLAAARGDDERAPVRRLACQQALLLLGPEAAEALREVLDDPRLGGLARVGLAERGATDVPPPSQELVFWLTVDTIAAQLGGQQGEESEADLRDLVEGVVSQHSGFFDEAWRVDHPATADVLEAMAELHPDRRTAKEARKAAFKARSRAKG